MERKAYKDINQMGSQISFLPWKLIWKIPNKVAIFTWLVAKEAVLIQENLVKRVIHMCPRCYSCEQNAKTINHLFLHCKVVSQLWKLFTSYRGIGIWWAMLERTGQALISRNTEGGDSTNKDRWIVPAVIWWITWEEKNSRCFEGNSSSIQRIKMNCILSFCYWYSSEYIDDPVSIVDILGSI